jgi:rubredoxin
MAKFKCRKCGYQQDSPSGKPKDAHCKSAGWDLVVEKSTRPDETTLFNSNTYKLIGQAGNVIYYGRVDRVALNTMDSDVLDAYETAMSKGILDKTSTGKDGVKLKETTAVIKLSISTATANQADNTQSLCADYVYAEKKAFLNFNNTIWRH